MKRDANGLWCWRKSCPWRMTVAIDPLKWQLDPAFSVHDYQRPEGSHCDLALRWLCFGIYIVLERGGVNPPTAVPK